MVRTTKALVENIFTEPMKITGDVSYMGNQLKAKGTVDGIEIEYITDIPDDKLEDDTFVTNFVSFLKASGFEAAAAKTPAAARNEQRSETVRNGGQEGCPVHGMSNAGSEYKGFISCSAFSEEPQPWTKDKSAIRRDGTEVYYCKNRWRA